VVYGEIEIGIRTYEEEIERERVYRRRYAIYRQMLREAIGEENVEEVEADYDQRWPKGHSMQQREYRLNYLNRYLATYLKRTPLDVFDEAQQRYQTCWSACQLPS
jgi:intergrase/recombinase